MTNATRDQVVVNSVEEMMKRFEEAIMKIAELMHILLS